MAVIVVEETAEVEIMAVAAVVAAVCLEFMRKFCAPTASPNFFFKKFQNFLENFQTFPKFFKFCWTYLDVFVTCKSKKYKKCAFEILLISMII